MAGQESRVFKLLSYAVCDGNRIEQQDVDNASVLDEVHNTCYEMMARDYTCEILNNADGQLCSTYPMKLIIPVSSKDGRLLNKLPELVHKCRFARTRGRFSVPVLLANGKYVCRSSTLARSPEIYCRHGYGYFLQGEPVDVDSEESSSQQPELNGSSTGILSVSECDSRNGNHSPIYSNGIHSSAETNSELGNGAINGNSKNKEWLLDKMRNADINLLHFLKVDTIFDLMVEKKKVKFGMNVTSSEKVDRQQRYFKFNLLSVPYPGCEFFKEYRDCNYKGEGLMFDWKQNFVDADLHIPDNIQDLPKIDWQDYVNWDLIRLTQNYLKLMLHSLVDSSSTGILLHCISGWDRTPLFVSLVRLSLWADGLAHQSLNAEEIIYFTIAYDWLVFSHQFGDRITKGEEIFYFCFDFLKYIDTEEYSMTSFLSNTDISNGENGERNIDSSFCLNNSNGEGTPAIFEVAEKNLERNGQASNGSEEHTESSLNSKMNHECENNMLNGTAIPNMTEKNGIVKFESDHSEAAVMDINESCSWSPNDLPKEDVHSIHNFKNKEKVACNNKLITSCPSKLEFEENCGPISSLSKSENSADPSYTQGHAMSGAEISTDSVETTGVENCNLFESGPEFVQERHSFRKQRLKRARECLIPAYQAALQQQRDHEQQQNTGFAASFFNQISRTLNLVKR